jgi:hypothetical protein
LGNKAFKGSLHQQQGLFPVPYTGFFQGFEGKIKIETPREYNNGTGQNKEIEEVFPPVASFTAAFDHPVNLPYNRVKKKSLPCCLGNPIR